MIGARKRKLVYRIIEDKVGGNGDPGRPRTLFVEQMISDAGLSNYTELKKPGIAESACLTAKPTIYIFLYSNL